MTLKRPTLEDLQRLAGQCAALEVLLVTLCWSDEERRTELLAAFHFAVVHFGDDNQREGAAIAFLEGFDRRAWELLVLLGMEPDSGESIQ